MASVRDPSDSDPLHYYSLLNLAPGASDTEVKDSYQRLSLVLHPDKQPEHYRIQATQQFTRLEEAKDVLLDPAKRFAYDHYGEAGLAILNQNRSKFANESWVLANPIDRRLFNEKIRRLIKQSNEQYLRSELNPRTDLTLSVSVADYLDSNGEDPLKLRPGAVQLQEMVRFNLSQRLAADLGFMVYAKGNLGMAVITPRLYWSLGNGLNAQFGAQLGERSSCTLAVYKTYQEW
jgi:curved DNA-binding protein CbpA